MVEEPPKVPEPDEQAPSLVGMTENMAGRALQKLRETASLPRVRQKATRAATRAAQFFTSLDTLGLKLIAALYIVTAFVGTLAVVIGVEPVGRLPDWMMHAAMYLVCFGLLVVYIRASRNKRRIARTLFCILSICAFTAFALLLIDRVDERLVFPDTGPGAEALPMVRPRMGFLWVPAIMLMLSALSLLVHWLFATASKHDVPAPPSRSIS